MSLRAERLFTTVVLWLPPSNYQFIPTISYYMKYGVDKHNRNKMCLQFNMIHTQCNLDTILTSSGRLHSLMLV